ncbi:MAG: hypothetical protein J6K26_09185 [Lachnospiraceae bacterium]|nr:hypothetical protein [Lachnospiraceae bacterium]
MDFSSISGYADYASQLAEKTTSQKLTEKAQGAQTDEELLEACKEFENYLWEQVVKSMKSTVDITGEDSSSSQMVDTFMDSAISDVAKNLTEQNLGPNSLAMQMYEQMKRTQTINVEELLAQGQAVQPDEE